MSGALGGVRVLDFGQYMAGPMAAMLLGDQGADVIRIDPPGGTRWNTPANATWNRNKRSIVLDLKNAADLATARDLVATADVLIENFRPGVMERLGLGPRQCTTLNPRLIYCSLPGFGADDPRAKVKAWEGVLGAATAMYAPRNASEGRPVYTAIPYSSAFAAFLGAVSIAVALNARGRSGRGQIVEVPLFDATFTAFGQRGLLIDGEREHEAGFTWNRPVLCKDGRWFMYDASNKKFGDFLEKTGLARWRDAGLDGRQMQQKWDEVALTRSAGEWEDLCASIGTEGIVCHTSAEWMSHPQALQSGTIAEFNDPELGAFRGPGINVRLSRTPGAVRSSRARLDAHRAEILNELASRKPASPMTEGARLRSALDGLKVLDLCIVLAGPTCGRTLAEFGADVIRIDSPHVAKVARHNDINRGKRSILVDLKTPEGLAIFWRLVDWADVMLQNFRNGVAEKLGIDYASVKACKPGIIYASINTYGQSGPNAGRPGHEGIAQAATGMQVRYGGRKPVPSIVPGNDYGTGLMTCYGVLLALLHRSQTGAGQFVDSALSYTATMLQSHLMQDYAGKKWNEPGGQDALGAGPLDRAYQAADGWLYITATGDELKRCVPLADVAGKRDDALMSALEARFKQQPVAQWLSVLQEADIGAHRVVETLTGLMKDPLSVARGLSLTRSHEGFGNITTTAPGARLSATPPTPGRPAPKPGSDAASVLAEIGMADQLERLVRERVIALDGVRAGC